MKLKYIINEQGNFNKLFDPWRTDPNDPWFLYLFARDGMLSDEAEMAIAKMMRKSKSRNWEWDCDVYCLLHANHFAMNTKGNYSALTYWR